MKRRLVLLLLGAASAAEAQAPAAKATTIQPVRCAAADSLLGPRLAGTRADLKAVYLPERRESLIFSAPPRRVPTRLGVRSATGLIHLRERVVGPMPALELTLRVVSEQERLAGTQWFRLLADDSLLGDSMPLALRRQDAYGLLRVVQTATVRLTPAQTLSLVRARRVSGALSDARFQVSDDELRELRGIIVVVGICGARHPW